MDPRRFPGGGSQAFFGGWLSCVPIPRINMSISTGLRSMRTWPESKTDLESRPADLNLPEEHGLTPLDLAVQHCMDDPEPRRTELVRFLLERGADPNPMTDRVSTALHFAAQVGSADVIIMLVHKHARTDSKDERGETPRQRAARFHNEAVAALEAIAAP